MKIPKGNKTADLLEKEQFLDEIIQICEASSVDRLNINQSLREYVLFGTAEETKVNYNKIYPTIDLLSSFLYGQETVAFSIRYGANAPHEQRRYQEELREKIREVWHDSNTDELFGQALFWALTYNSFFIKLLWNGGVRTFPLEPHMLGVYREDISSIDNQEALVHLYYLTSSELNRMLQQHPRRDEIMAKVSTGAAPPDDNVPKTVTQIIMTQTHPNLAGAANAARKENIYRPYFSPNLCTMREIWCWDDDAEDYRCFTRADPGVIIYERSGADMFMKGEHPFVKITPSPLPNYFWGKSLVQDLIGLQDWRDKHLSRLDLIFRRILKPSRVFTGPWAGLSDEKMTALDTPGGFFNSAMPNAKVDTYKPEVDLAQAMGYIEKIDGMFHEMAGLPPILRAEGQEGVRSMEHADLLSRMASSRGKKKALITEDPLEKLATLMLKLQRLHDKEKYVDSEGEEFFLSQVTDNFEVKVSGHTSSPLFQDSIHQMANELLQAKAIDRRTYLQLREPPMAEMLEERLKKIEEGEATQAKAKLGVELIKAAKHLGK